MTRRQADEVNQAGKPKPESTPVEPAERAKPVELVELLQRRAAKRRRFEAPTSSPFYDAEFVANHRKRKRKRH